MRDNFTKIIKGFVTKLPTNDKYTESLNMEELATLYMYVQLSANNRYFGEKQVGNCTELSMFLAYQILNSKDKELSELKVGLVSFKGLDHMVVIVFGPSKFPEWNLTNMGGFRFEKGLCELSKKYPEAVLLDPWNNISFTLGLKNKKSCLDYKISALLHEVNINIPTKSNYPIKDFYFNKAPIVVQMYYTRLKNLSESLEKKYVDNILS